MLGWKSDVELSKYGSLIPNRRMEVHDLKYTLNVLIIKSFDEHAIKNEETIFYSIY